MARPLNTMASPPPTTSPPTGEPRPRAITEAGQSSFRPDIEGLRALAILPILLLHCGVSQVRGGYVGVDVFFVISGYLITGILARDMGAKRFSLGRFYAHRAARILPALAVVMIATGLAALWLMLPVEIEAMSGSMIAAAMFAANIHFNNHIDYFAQSAEAMPLIHLWSLAVEEQFYLLFPLLLFFIVAKLKYNPRKPLAVLLVLSFAAGAVMGWKAPQSAYYLLPARAWELLAGGLLALGASSGLPDTGYRKPLHFGAMGILVLSCLFIKSSLPFPVPFALFPVLATVVIIATGKDSVFLVSGPLRYLGRISFALYLVHRPLIAFYTLLHGSERHLGDVAFLILGSLLLGMALHHGIERPLNIWGKRISTRRVLTSSALGLTAMALAAWLLGTQAHVWRPLPPRAAFAASYLGYNNTTQGKAQFDSGHCFILPDSPAGTGDGCLASAVGRDNILLLGDSHAAQFSRALREFLPADHLIQATAAGCRPLLSGKGLTRCRAVFRQAIERKDWGRISTVILAGRWLPNEIGNVAETAQYLASKGPRVIVIGPMVEYDVDLPRLATLSILRNDGDLPAGHLLADRFTLDAALARLVRATPAAYFSPQRAECPAGRCRLFATDGSPMHFDHSHLTYGASRDLLPGLLAARAFPHGSHQIL